jgi:hypothetical protein
MTSMLHLFQAGPGTERPAYHVLIIGISRYDHLRGGDGVLATEPLAEGLEQLAAAATSAVRVALWFRDHFDSPGATRGSIRLLVSPALDELPLPKGVTADPATYENVREAVVAWRRDLRTHSGNVAVLYVAGHGIQTSAEGGIVLLQDFGSPDSLTPLERAIDVTAVRRGIVADPNQPDTATPELQFYFYDACRITSPAAAGYASLAAGIALDEPRGTPPRASWVSFGSRPQDYALAVVATRTTLYSQAFLDCLDRRARPDDDGRTIRFAGLQSALEEAVSELAAQYGEQQDAVLGGSGSIGVPVHRRPRPQRLPTRGARGGPRREVIVHPDRPAPVSVRGDAGELVAEYEPGTPLWLPFGVYRAVVPLPWGGEHTQRFTVRSGPAPVDVFVDVPDAPSDLMELPQLERQLAGIAGPVDRYTSPLHLRFMRWSDGTFAPSLDRVPALRFTDVGAGTITIEAEGGRTPYLQIRSESGQSQLVVLPRNTGEPGSSPACRVHVRSGDRGIATAVRLADTDLDAIAGYLTSGRADRALTALPEQAEALLFRKLSRPLGAALGGYALLKLNELERMHHWPMNLARRVRWLPDGPVIAGVLAARQGRPDSAAEYFTQAAGRGVPVFSEGLSLLIAGAAALERDADVPNDLAAELHRLVEPIREIGVTAAFGSLVTSLRLDPDWHGFTEDQGWLRLPAAADPG